MSFPAILKTLAIINEIEKNKLQRDLRQRLKELLRSVQDSIKEIEAHLRTPKCNSFKNKIKLCISQMAKVIPSIIHLLSEANHSAFEDIADYQIEKLKWCLMEPIRMFNGGGIDEDMMEASGIFVTLIDWAIVSLQTGEQVNDTYKSAIDDLLCQALTIAKLATAQDYNEISSGCRSVLISLSSAIDKRELSESTRRLHRDILLCNLETLYRRVNTAVLRLFLYVMSDSFHPLKNIVIKCVENHTNVKEKNKRRPSDLNHLISQLDLYLEQIYLLGNFAVACTDRAERKLQVQCSLASLEFCETHLIPAIISFYLDQHSRKRDYLSFLTDEAQKSLKDLHFFIDNIVDTGSFARVVFEDLTDLTRTIRENISDGIFEKKECELFQRRCNKVIQHLLTTDDKDVRQDPTVQQVVKQLLSVLKNQSDHLKTCSLTVNHIIWDLDLGLELLDRLCQKLNFSALNHASVGRISIDRSVTFPNSIKNLPLDTSSSTIDKNMGYLLSGGGGGGNGGQSNVRNGSSSTPAQNNISKTEEDGDNGVTPPTTLEPYLIRVGETPMIKSTLYCRTPIRTSKSLKFDRNRTTFDFIDILDGISKLSNDLPSLKSENHNNTNSSSNHNSKRNSDHDLHPAFDLLKFDQGEHLNDLFYLNHKINELKK